MERPGTDGWLLIIAVALAAAAPGARAHAAGATVVVAWNELAFDVGFAEDELRTFKTQHTMAMMHLAMHDAVNAVLGRYSPYAFRRSDPAADATVAAAQAAHDVIVAQYPGAAERAGAALAPWVAAAPKERSVRSIALGQEAAAAVLDARRNDGWNTAGDYVYVTAPGAYQTTPPWSGFVLQPGFGDARPFGLRSASQLRPQPPPALESPRYAAAFEEVRRQGARDGAERTAEQTGYALWWMEFAEGSVNRLARRLAVERGLDLGDAARLFALLDMALYDAYVATWDAKYEYNHWRPVTAIRAAREDGNPATSAVAGWEPLRPTPPFPEYVSAHAAGCAGAFEALRRSVGEETSFGMRTTTAPEGMTERRFPSFSAAAAECADSRVRLGWHFRYATDAGLALGHAVAAWLDEHHLRPR